MLPNLSVLSLRPQSPPMDRCVPINANLSEVLRPQNGNENPSACAICLESLSGDTVVDNSTDPPTDNRWTDGTSNRPGRRGPYVRTVCEQDHVYHTGCIVDYAIRRGLNNANAQTCPECKTGLRPVIKELARDVVAASVPLARAPAPAPEILSEMPPFVPSAISAADFTRLRGRFAAFRETLPTGVASWEISALVRAVRDIDNFVHLQRLYGENHATIGAPSIVAAYLAARGMFADDDPIAAAASAFVIDVRQTWLAFDQAMVAAGAGALTAPAPAPAPAPALAAESPPARVIPEGADITNRLSPWYYENKLDELRRELIEIDGNFPETEISWYYPQKMVADIKRLIRSYERDRTDFDPARSAYFSLLMDYRNLGRDLTPQSRSPVDLRRRSAMVWVANILRYAYWIFPGILIDRRIDTIALQWHVNWEMDLAHAARLAMNPIPGSADYTRLLEKYAAFQATLPNQAMAGEIRALMIALRDIAMLVQREAQGVRDPRDTFSEETGAYLSARSAFGDINPIAMAASEYVMDVRQTWPLFNWAMVRAGAGPLAAPAPVPGPPPAREEEPDDDPMAEIRTAYQAVETAIRNLSGVTTYVPEFAQALRTIMGLATQRFEGEAQVGMTELYEAKVEYDRTRQRVLVDGLRDAEQNFVQTVRTHWSDFNETFEAASAPEAPAPAPAAASAANPIPEADEIRLRGKFAAFRATFRYDEMTDEIRALLNVLSDIFVLMQLEIRRTRNPSDTLSREAVAYLSAIRAFDNDSRIAVAASEFVNDLRRTWPLFNEAMLRAGAGWVPGPSTSSGQGVRRPRVGEDAQRVTMQRINMALGSM